MEAELHKNGFVFLKNVLSTSEIQKGISTIQDKSLDYVRMEEFVTNNFLQKINQKFGWQTIYTKFRVSDNNNSVDASAFHRDILPIGKVAKAEAPPIYTILTYFDKTVMEVVPGSHNEPEMSYAHAVSRYFDAIRLTIEPGDMLIFHATLLHRGIFTENQAHRRVLQVFECFPSSEVYKTYKDKICHIPGQEKFQSIMIQIAKMPFFIFFSNLAGYMNSATGYGSHLANMRDECSVDNYDYLSSEGLTKRTFRGQAEVQPLNKYFLREGVHDLPKECYEKFKFNYYNKQFLIYFVLFIVLLAAAIFFSYKLISLIGLGSIASLSKSTKPRRRGGR